MKKVNVNRIVFWRWDCPKCGNTNDESVYSVDELDLVCNCCTEEFELGEHD